MNEKKTNQSISEKERKPVTEKNKYHRNISHREEKWVIKMNFHCYFIFCIDLINKILSTCSGLIFVRRWLIIKIYNGWEISVVNL
jgi:hypothetical protein